MSSDSASNEMSEVRESGSNVSGSNEVASVWSLDGGEVVRVPVEPVENESNSVHSSLPDDSMDAVLRDFNPEDQLSLGNLYLPPGQQPPWRWRHIL